MRESGNRKVLGTSNNSLQLELTTTNNQNSVIFRQKPGTRYRYTVLYIQVTGTEFYYRELTRYSVTGIHIGLSIAYSNFKFGIVRLIEKVENGRKTSKSAR